MKKGVKAALITAAGCMVAGGVLMGAGRAAGGYSQLYHINGWSLPGRWGWMTPWNYSIYALPGLGNLLDAIDSNSDYWEDRVDDFADKWEDWGDRFSDRWEDKADRWAEKVEDKVDAAAVKWENKVDAAFDDWDDDWNEAWEDGNFYDDDSYKGGDTAGYTGEEPEPGQEVYNGDFDVDIVYSGALNQLDVEIGIHGLEIVEGTENTVHIQGKNCDRIQCYVKNGKLYVKDVGKNKKYGRTNNRKITLTVPAGIVWSEVELEADMSYIRTENLQAVKALLEADMGSVEIWNLTVEKLTVDAEMGGVAVRKMQTGYLEIDAEMGNVELAGTVNGNIDVDAEMGSVELRLNQKREDFNYELTSSMGGIELGNKSYGGLDRAKYINNGADKKMDLDSSMGSIEISFK